MKRSTAGVPFALESPSNGRERKGLDHLRLSDAGPGRFGSRNSAGSSRGTSSNRGGGSRGALPAPDTTARDQSGEEEVAPRYAFINLPYSKRYERVYLAFIAGLAGYGLVPSTALHDPSSRSQLDRIYDLIARAEYSFHDVSWMTLDYRSPHTPRLNMTLELGLAIAISRASGSNHQWFVFDTVPYRLDKALSDLGGIRPRIHDFTPKGVLSALMNALARQQHQPTLRELLKIYDEVEKVARRIKRQYSNNLFDARPFKELVLIANDAAHRFIASLSV